LKGWLLDTNVIAEVSGARPDPRVERWFEAQPEYALFLSILTIAEYLKGIENLPSGDRRRHF
jgi:toxin FitB